MPGRTDRDDGRRHTAVHGSERPTHADRSFRLNAPWPHGPAARASCWTSIIVAALTSSPVIIVAADGPDDIEWVVVGDPGNPPDTTGHGAVAHPFEITRHEITVAQYATFLSAVAARDPHGLWQAAQGVVREGEAGAYRYSPAAGRERHPVMHVSFLDAMRFANWLHHVDGAPAGASSVEAAIMTETGAYPIAEGGGLAARSPAARVWIPSEDEWYKAAYFQPATAGGPPGGYWRYPTRSDEPPALGAPGDTAPGLANFLADTTPQPNGDVLRHQSDVFPVGSFPGSGSHYGTLDQAGNAWEWIEVVVFDTQRGMRGGNMCGSHEKLLKTVRTSASPTRRYPDTGFRLARAVPLTGPQGASASLPENAVTP
jgi:formylglycine-generating enzyme required for sulfatase activity